MRTKKTRTYIPPAFYDRDGSFVQPPTFEMPAYVRKDSRNWLGSHAKSGMMNDGKQQG